jgi:hypothetical protein
MDPRIRALLEANLDDVLAALGWRNVPILSQLTRRLARPTALRFAREMAAFDDEVDRAGIASGAGTLLAGFVRDVRVRGIHHIPPRGPCLLLSNHPGMTDTLVLLSSIPRRDLLVLAAERPFLGALHAALRSLILLPDERERRMAAVRRAVSHLRSGGALLTFPAGEIEPDPAFLPGAVEAIHRWSNSSMAFLRFAPGCTVVPMIVSGVLEPRAQRSPLVILLRRKTADRERLAAMLQVLVHTRSPSRWRTRACLDVLPAIPGRDLLARGDGANAALIQAVADFLRSHERAGPGWFPGEYAPPAGRRRRPGRTGPGE